MNKDEKVEAILSDMSTNYLEFCRQAKIKLYKHAKLCDNNSYKELVSDVLFSVISKLNTTENINKFYKMTEKNKLKLYILKGISTNTSFFSAPFLRKKLQESKRLIFYDNIEYYEEEFDEITEQEEENIINLINSFLEKPKAPELFGEDWKYYTNLFKEYIHTKSTYASLGQKYSIPVSSIAFHIRYVKTKIREELKKS